MRGLPSGNHDTCIHSITNDFTVSIGPVTIHIYALCILLGIVLAVWITTTRWKKLGGNFDQVLDITLVSVPAGIVVPASITSSLRPNVFLDRMVTGRRCSASGMVDLASGAECCLDRWPHGLGAGTSIIRWPCWLTPSPRDCWWRRLLGVWATGSIRSCMARRRLSHGSEDQYGRHCHRTQRAML